MLEAETRERWRRQLPHWEVAGRPHFITIRCADTLPAAVRQRLGEIREALRNVAPQSTDFARLQRHHFLVCEKYLDTGCGFAPFLDYALCARFVRQLESMEHAHGWRAPNWVIMPNHIHLVLTPLPGHPEPLRKTIAGLKGQFARRANQHLHRSGPFWQTEWFDHWIRSESELLRIIDYTRQNPVKVGLVPRWQDYRWVR